MTGPADRSAGVSTGTAGGAVAGAAANCRNCGYLLGDKPGNFCPNCGQETALHPLPAGGFVRHFAREYVSPRGHLMRTLGLLVFRPGELTRRYLAGKRKSYVLPLRLYFAASLLFFLVVKIFGAGNLANTTDSAELDGAVIDLSGTPAAPAKGIRIGKPGPPGVRFDPGEGGWDTPFLKDFNCSGTSVPCEKIRAYMLDKYGDASRREVMRQVRDRLIAYAPNAMFALLPVFALFTKALYWRRRMNYGEHMVYAMHVHAFSFLLLLSLALLPAGFKDWLTLAGMIYFALAMRRVFGGRWWATALRYAVIGLLYPLLLSLAIILTLAAAVIF